MKITLLDWNGAKHYVEIPDDTETITGRVVSGDMIMTSPIYHDTGENTRIMNFNDGSFSIDRKDFHKLDTMSDPYEIFELC
jgi:hypothetical protein